MTVEEWKQRSEKLDKSLDGLVKDVRQLSKEVDKFIEDTKNTSKQFDDAINKILNLAPLKSE